MELKKYICIEDIGNCLSGKEYYFFLNEKLSAKKQDEVAKHNSNDSMVYTCEIDGKHVINIGKELLESRKFFVLAE